MPFWQLAEGESAFRVAVLHIEAVGSPRSRSVDEPVTLWIQHESTGISTAVTLPINSTLLQLKIAAFEQLSLGDAVAALNPRVGFSFNGQLLDNEATVHSVGLGSGDRVFLSERSTPPSSLRSSPVGEKHHSLIADIWAHSDSSEDESLTLPNALLLDEPDTRSRPRRHSDRKSRTKRQESELAQAKSTYRTKMCRAGLGNCKFGSNCWFAHTPEELRKPSEPLPAHCPGVSKLEKYTKRQEVH